MRTLFALALLVGCGPVKIDLNEENPAETGLSRDADDDRDGSPASEDCDDQDPAVHPGSEEVCDGIDNDCDGFTDAEDPDLSDLIWYTDADGDGYGDDASATLACEQPEGMIATGGDCDDADTAYHPGADELDCADPSDYNCDGSTGQDDLDADGFAACEDCDDGDSDVNADATEVCDEQDNDCDGLIDDADTVADASTWYTDADSDGYGDDSSGIVSCELVEGRTTTGGDCDDGDAAWNPAAEESDCADPNDYNCDGSVAYADGDGDGYAACEDCDDGDADSHPGGLEVCDGADNDCDGLTDDADTVADASTWYKDADGDRYGLDEDTVVACDAPAGYVRTGGDCDDDNDELHPGVTEICDSQDNDCDGYIDDADSDLVGGSTWYEDGDGDSFGSSSTSVKACSKPSGYASTATDCDDADGDVHPGAEEACDAVDNDCSDYIDDGDSCPCEMDWYGDHAYMFCTSRSSWSTGDSACASYGYQLTSLNDSSETSWVESAAYSVRSSRAWWIGFTDSATEGTWAWEDASGSTYTDWASGEPNDYYGSQDCALIYPYYSRWYDYYCTYSDWTSDTGIGYICETP